MKQGYPDGCIHELFERQVARTPGRVALIAGNERLTFGELNARANQVARWLAARGVRRDVFAGICLERSVPAIVALLGILKAGGAYVYLDPSYPAHRLQEMARDSAVRLVITDRVLAATIFGQTESVELLFPDSAEIAQQEATNLGASVDLDDPAYLIYTSGSTGRPKGAVEVHGSMTSRLISVPLPDIQPSDVCCLNSSLSFGISASRLFFPLVQGAPVVVLDERSVKDVGRFVNAIDSHRITSVFMVPALLREVLRLLEQGVGRLTSLRAVTVSGGALLPDLIDRFRRALPETLLINIYGSTEIGTTAAMRVIDASTPSSPPSIGKPVANTKIYILEHGLNPVPPGATGEICVAAEHLAREYLNQPRLTAERFLASPFAEKTRERLCRTGDLGRYLPNGEIEFLGRADHQVKIRGYRVELGEIESVLLCHPAIQDGVVVAHGAEEEKRLVAYLVSTAAVPPGASELRRFAAGQLPDYMLPAAFIMLPQLPLTDAGKVDRAALPEPSQTGTVAEDGLPETAVEKSVAQLWSELLKVERISVHDNFIELGGDSLAANRMLAAIHGEFGTDIPARLVFDGTLREFARQIHQSAAGAA
jgi:amino acid adenylation domain-containing protein